MHGNCRRRGAKSGNILCYFPPQNNVSMFSKWIFVRLLMLVPIKLYRFNAMDLFTFRAYN